MKCSSTESIPEFGEALAFYTIDEMPDTNAELLIVYRPLTDLQQALKQQWYGVWGAHIAIARVASIQAIVGIWKGIRTKQIYVLRKHPGLSLLSEMERGNTKEGDEEADEPVYNPEIR